MKDGVMITCQDYPAALIITSSCRFRWSSRAFKGRRRSRGRSRQSPQKKNHACSFLSASPDQVKLLRMNASAAAAGGAKAAPPKFKQKDSRQFKSKAPRPGQKGFDNDVPGMEGLGDSAVVCPWEAFGDMELSDLAQFGIV